MCGIVGYIGQQSCERILLDGLSRLEYRGYDSAGIAINTGSSIERRRAEGKLSALENRVREEPITGSVGIGHTRWATHGAPNEVNAHPHMIDGVVVVHNGIIENHLELRKQLESEGAEFYSETDTEIVAHLIARSEHRGSSLRAAVRDAIEHIRGSFALVVLDERYPDLMVAARLASPLVLGVGEGENFVASDVPAIMSHTRDVIFLNDGDLVELREESFTIYDKDRIVVERPIKRILWDPASAEKQGYRHFMLKEIHEQPDRIVDTLRGRISLERNVVEFHDLTFDETAATQINRIVILACGTSYHAGLVGKYAIEHLARIPVECDLASEFRYRDPIIDERTLVLSISQSGETADTLAATQEAMRLGGRAICICNVMESSLTRTCESTIYTHAGPEIGVASTKAFTTQLAALYLFAIWLAQARKTVSDERRATLLHELRELPGQIEECLQEEDAIAAFAKDYADARSFLYLGRGMQFPIALEGALKLKEISYIHAEGYAAGEMKHGPIALIDETLPVVVVAPDDRHFEKVRSNLEEVKARGGRILSVTSAPYADQMKTLCNNVMSIPEIDEVFQPLLTVIPLQLLAYYIADFKGTDIDQPRNLAKSVTVE